MHSYIFSLIDCDKQKSLKNNFLKRRKKKNPCIKMLKQVFKDETMKLLDFYQDKKKKL